MPDQTADDAPANIAENILEAAATLSDEELDELLELARLLVDEQGAA